MNDARYFDWPPGLRRYIDDIRQGRGQNSKQYSARYVCSLVRMARNHIGTILHSALQDKALQGVYAERLCKFANHCGQAGRGPADRRPSSRRMQVADFHRTLLYGGVAMNPRSHLRLVYEANPLAFLAEQAGGRVRLCSPGLWAQTMRTVTSHVHIYRILTTCT